MLIKMLGLIFAGVFIGAAALEMKTDRHGKKKERKARRSDEDENASNASQSNPTSAPEDS